MLDILHGISENQDTVRYLAQKASRFSESGSSSVTTPTDLRDITEKVKHHLNSKAFMMEQAAINQANKNKVSKAFQERKLLTLDFVTDYKEDDPRDIGPLSCVPVSSQESAIVQDLLFCFVGINGVHVKPIRKGDQITFEIDPKVNPTLKELLKRIIPLCRHYSTVVSFVEKHTLMGSGCVNQALSQALGDVLKDYYVFVAQLETQHRLGELTLNKMWSYIQPTMDAMSFMADLCGTIEKVNARGGKTLSLLHEKCVNQSLASTEKLRELGLLLTRSAADCYFKVIHSSFTWNDQR